jgi:hypothetical protein
MQTSRFIEISGIVGHHYLYVYEIYAIYKHSNQCFNLGLFLIVKLHGNWSTFINNIGLMGPLNQIHREVKGNYV